MTFILAEDKALREKLLGIIVTDQKSSGSVTQRKVGVWFGTPDIEIAQQTYPYITIDLIDISRANDREMRGWSKPQYMTDPDTIPVQGVQGLQVVQFSDQTMDWRIHTPIPMNLDYQITTYSRAPMHDREILAQLMGYKLPIRFGYLEPEDGTIRRLDVLDVSKRDSVEGEKRLFMNAITVRVSSELPVDIIQALYKVLQVNVTGSTGPTYWGDSFTITAPTVNPG